MWGISTVGFRGAAYTHPAAQEQPWCSETQIQPTWRKTELGSWSYPTLGGLNRSLEVPASSNAGFLEKVQRAPVPNI